VEAPGGESGNV